jgi:hypothetical protein
MSRRLRLSVETILRLTPDDQALLAAREAIGSRLRTLGSICAVLLAFISFVVSQLRRARLRREGVCATRTPTFVRARLMAAQALTTRRFAAGGADLMRHPL